MELFLACCNASVRSKFPINAKDSKIDQARNIFPTLHDAVLAAMEPSGGLTLRVSELKGNLYFSKQVF